MAKTASKKSIFDNNDLSAMEKMQNERKISVKWFLKSPSVMIGYGRVTDAVHDLEIMVEADMTDYKIVDVGFKFNTCVNDKCLALKEMEKQMLGMSLITETKRTIRKLLAGANGCTMLCELAQVVTEGMYFNYHLTRLKKNQITAEEFAKLKKTDKESSCIALNPND